MQSNWNTIKFNILAPNVKHFVCDTLFCFFQTFATLNERFSSFSQTLSVGTIVVD